MRRLRCKHGRGRRKYVKNSFGNEGPEVPKFWNGPSLTAVSDSTPSRRSTKCLNTSFGKPSCGMGPLSKKGVFSTQPGQGTAAWTCSMMACGASEPRRRKQHDEVTSTCSWKPAMIKPYKTCGSIWQSNNTCQDKKASCNKPHATSPTSSSISTSRRGAHLSGEGLQILSCCPGLHHRAAHTLWANGELRHLMRMEMEYT